MSVNIVTMDGIGSITNKVSIMKHRIMKEEKILIIGTRHLLVTSLILFTIADKYSLLFLVI